MDQTDQADDTINRVAPNGGKRLRPSGGYRKLRSFQVTTIIYDATVRFCDRFVEKRSRTVDQMTQAARSGRRILPRAAAPRQPQAKPNFGW